MHDRTVVLLNESKLRISESGGSWAQVVEQMWIHLGADPTHPGCDYEHI